MPICIILDPLDPLIHIEGGSGCLRARAATAAAAQSGTATRSPPVLARGAAPQHPPGLHGPERPFGAGSPGTAAELRPGSAAGARNEHEQNHLIIRKRQLASSM
jgi:hypothetical protein